MPREKAYASAAERQKAYRDRHKLLEEAERLGELLGADEAARRGGVLTEEAATDSEGQGLPPLVRGDLRASMLLTVTDPSVSPFDPFDMIREALIGASRRSTRDSRRLALAALDRLQRDHEALSEGFKRNLRLGTEEIRAERDAAVREAETLRGRVEALAHRLDPPHFGRDELEKLSRTLTVCLMYVGPVGISPHATEKWKLGSYWRDRISSLIAEYAEWEAEAAALASSSDTTETT